MVLKNFSVKKVLKIQKICGKKLVLKIRVKNFSFKNSSVKKYKKSYFT